MAARIHRLAVLLGCFALAAPLAAQSLPGTALESLHLPAEDLAFIENRGQWAEDVAFLAPLDGVDVWVTATGVVYDFYTYAPASGASTQGGGGRLAERRRGRVLRARFVGGRAVRVEGRSPLPTTRHYLLGDDPAKWASGVALYEEVVLHELYAGVSLVLRAGDGVLRQEFVLDPGADVGQVRVDVGGAEGLDLSGAGVLDRAAILGLVEPEGGGRDSSGPRGEAPGPAEPSTHLRYARFLGGSGEERVGAVEVDAVGASYVGGWTASDDFPTPNGFDNSLHGFSDAFVAQIAPDGGQLYGTYLGGNRHELVNDVAYADGSFYLAGVTASPNFPTTTGAYVGGGGNQENAFVTRMRPDGTGPLFSTILGGDGDDAGGDDDESDSTGGAVAVTPTGAVVVGGRTYAEDFPAPNGTAEGGGDAFVVVLSSDGASLQGGTFLGGEGLDEVRAIALSGGDVYAAGETNSDDFSGLGGGFGGGTDAFVVRLSGSGSSLLGGTYIGGSSWEGASGPGAGGR
ncbi:MAG: hypothetical protein R3362_08055, partial [Rhodothermales bacterium]|nr:hypothetical protein [Rhodothermales bacterium]